MSVDFDKPLQLSNGTKARVLDKRYDDSFKVTVTQYRVVISEQSTANEYAAYWVNDNGEPLNPALFIHNTHFFIMNAPAKSIILFDEIIDMYSAYANDMSSHKLSKKLAELIKVAVEEAKE